jgi:hypothetical protein
MEKSLDLVPLSTPGRFRLALSLECTKQGDGMTRLGISLRKCGTNLYVRSEPEKLVSLGPVTGGREVIIYIASRLRGGWFSGTDDFFAIRDRVRALQIQPHSGVFINLAEPLSNWDYQDGVFFDNGSSTEAWSVFGLEGMVTPGQPIMRLSAVLVCLGWNNLNKPLEYTIVAFSESSVESARLFFLGLKDVKHGSGSQLRNLFGSCFRLPIQPRSVSVPMELPGGVRSTALVMPVVTRVRDESICSNDIWRVRLDIEPQWNPYGASRRP